MTISGKNITISGKKHDNLRVCYAMFVRQFGSNLYLCFRDGK